MAGAYRIQELAIGRWPDSLAGWKIGYIPADRRTTGDPDRLIGPIWRRQLHLGEEHTSSPEVGVFAAGFAADFGNNHASVLGPVITDRAGGAAIWTSCHTDGQLHAEGSEENLPGGLHHGLATALNLLAERGHLVRAGMLFATGATTGVHEIGVGQHCRVEVPGGPSVELRTVDARAGRVEPVSPR